MSNSETIKKIRCVMTEELYSFLGSLDDYEKIEPNVINKIILDEKENIKKLAKQMYEDYKSGEDYDELITGGEADLYRKYLEDIFSKYIVIQIILMIKK